MKKIFVLPWLIVALSIFCSCQKPQTEAERQAEIQREVQRQLDAEHQAQEKEQLAQRQSDLDAREKALADKENAAKPSVERETRETGPVPQQRPAPPVSQRPAGSYSTFYTKLESHGDWRETSDYGYVWQPREAQSRNWRPYTNGHWVYTDVGWTWVSEEPFGWATYHYGRWTRLRNIGWVWVPGDEWAPAWVSWRKSDDYVGWAPLPPEARFDRRSGIHNWSDNYYDVGPDQYCFVATREFGGERMQRSVVPSERNITIVNQTTNVTNITYNNTTVVNQGPNFEELRSRTQRPIQRLRLEREVNVNINVGEPRPVVRGETLFIPAPLIARGQAVERPRAIKETVAHVEIDRGWEGISDRQAVEKTRAKMKSEATPPPDAPSKIFVKPGPVAEASPAAATSTSASVAPAATHAPAATASPTAPPIATATPFRRQPKPLETMTPPASPSAPLATATPRPRPTPPTVVRPHPSVRPQNYIPVASPAPTATPAMPIFTPSSSVPPRLNERRPNKRQMASSPLPAADEAAAAPSDMSKKQERKERRRERRHPGETEASPTPSASAEPQ